MGAGMKRGGLLLVGLVLALLIASYWLLPAYVLPPMDISQRPAEKSEPVAAVAPVTSYVFIPLALSVENIKQKVREELSGKILASNIKVPGRDLQVTIQRNGTLALWVRDAELHMVLPIKFQTRGDLKTKGELTLVTRASFDVTEDWEPQIDARSTFRWDSQPRVGFWPFRFRIGKLLSPYIQLALDRGADDFRAKAAGLYNLRSIADAAWERLHGPHPLDTEGQTWLAMQPRELYMEPITSDESEVRLNVWMGGELGIAQGVAPAAAETVPLPKLRHGTPPSKNIVLSAPLTIAYERMLASLRQALVDKSLPSSSGNLIITDVELFSAGTDVALGLRFKGQRTGNFLPSHGQVYLTGQPHFDPATRTLSIRNLKVTQPGGSPLAHGAKWVLQHAPSWSTELERRLSWDVAPLLDQHRQSIDSNLNHTVDNHFDLWGKTMEVVTTGVRPQPQGVMLQTQARGELELLFVP
jgi:hypothetical protein